jgi:cytochrome c peroxidase
MGILAVALAFQSASPAGAGEAAVLDVDIKGVAWFRDGWAGKYYQPLPMAAPGSEADAPEVVALGERLFSDPVLSADQSVSCATCHRLERGFAGADGLSVSKGVTGRVGRRNAPSVLNAAFQFAQFWDGRASTLEAQAREPLLSPDEMGNASEREVEDRLRRHDVYPALFRVAFPAAPEAVTFDHLVQALAAFQRTLVSPGRIDQWLAGDDLAMGEREVQGFQRFLEFQCHSCHSSPMFGGGMFQKVGLVKPFPNTEDRGRAEATGEAADAFIFKVPSLRNVALTAPYFHDGSAASLEEAVRTMTEIQVGIQVSDEDIGAIAAFLRSLSDPAFVPLDAAGPIGQSEPEPVIGETVDACGAGSP